MDLVKKRILLVEDDFRLAHDIMHACEEAGFVVRCRDTGFAATQAGLSDRFDLVIMEGFLSGFDALEIVRTWNRAGVSMPIIVLATPELMDGRMKILESLGALILQKPFAPEQLLRLAFKCCAIIPQTELRVGDLVLDLRARTLDRAGRKIDLPAKEFEVLRRLMATPGQVVERKTLFEEIWRYSFTAQNNLVDVHVGKLRRKLDEPGQPSLIRSIRGQGFMFVAPQADTSG